MIIKDKIVHNYLHIKEKFDYPLDDLVVNCNDWVADR